MSIVEPGLNHQPPAQATEEVWLQHCARVSALGDGASLQAALSAALQAHPHSVRLRYNHGVLLKRLGEPTQARESWLAVLAIEPLHAKAHRSLAELSLTALDGPSARHHASHALPLPGSTIASTDIATVCLLGKALLVCGDWDEALRLFSHARQSAIALGAASTDAERGWQLARLLTSRGHFNAEDLQAWREADWLRHATQGMRDDSPDWAQPARIDPEIQALSILADMGMARVRACDWRERGTVIRALERMAERVKSDPGLATPKPAAWEALHLGLSQEQLLWLARGACNLARGTTAPEPLRQPARGSVVGTDRRIRLAYLSHDFGRHPTTQLMHRVLAQHDRDRFDVIAYALNPDDQSPARRRIQTSVDELVDASGWPAQAVAQRIHDDRIDVLIGLGGHTTGDVVNVALWRPVPVQVNYLSFCGTVGARGAFDVHIADEIALPDELAQWYDEEVICLPGGHYAYDDTRQIGPVPSRASEGLPQDQLVLCGFNNSHKIEPSTFGAWMTILHRLPGSMLWLLQVHREQAGFLQQAARERGIDPQRLVFAHPVAHDNYLDRLGCADLFLDTFEYNGHTSMLDVMYAGLPAITRCGLTSSGRIASAFLHEAGLPELIAPSTQAFIDIAVALGQDPARRAAISAHLHGLRQQQAAPFSSLHRCRALEAVYTRLARAV